MAAACKVVCSQPAANGSCLQSAATLLATSSYCKHATCSSSSHPAASSRSLQQWHAASSSSSQQQPIDGNTGWTRFYLHTVG